MVPKTCKLALEDGFVLSGQSFGAEGTSEGEASPGPHDATYLFDCFRAMMATGRAPTAENMHAAQEKLAKAGNR